MNHKIEGKLKHDSFFTKLALGGFFCFACLVLIWLTEIGQVDNPREDVALICMMVFFLLMTFWTAMEKFFVKGSYNANQIIFSTPWTGRKSESWSDLESVRLNLLAECHVLRFKSGNKIRLSTHLLDYKSGEHIGFSGLLKAKGYDF